MSSSSRDIMKVGDTVQILKSITVVSKCEVEDVDYMDGTVTDIAGDLVKVDIGLINEDDSVDMVSIETNQCYLRVIKNKD